MGIIISLTIPWSSLMVHLIVPLCFTFVICPLKLCTALFLTLSTGPMKSPMSRLIQHVQQLSILKALVSNCTCLLCFFVDHVRKANKPWTCPLGQWALIIVAPMVFVAKANREIFFIAPFLHGTDRMPYRCLLAVFWYGGLFFRIWLPILVDIICIIDVMVADSELSITLKCHRHNSTGCFTDDAGPK
jgi:hypothetical protein